MLGPTCTLRSCLWAMTSLRSRDRSAAYCSKLKRSPRVSFFTLCFRQAVGHSEQRQRMRRRRRRVQSAFYLMTRHRAVAGIEIRAAHLNALDDRLADLHGVVAKLALDAIGSVVPRAPFDRFHRGSGYQLQHVARLESDILHPQMTGDVIRDLAEGACEIRAHQTGLVAQCQIFERIENMPPDL